MAPPTPRTHGEHASAALQMEVSVILWHDTVCADIVVVAAAQSERPGTYAHAWAERHTHGALDRAVHDVAQPASSGEL